MTEKSVVVYGSGAMGRAVISFLRKKEINIAYIADRNEKIKNTFIDNIEINLPDELPDIIKNSCDFIVSMSACPYTEVKEYLFGLGVKSVFSASEYIKGLYPDINFVNLWSAKKTVLDNVDTEMFADKESVSYYKSACKWFTEYDDSNPIDLPFLLDRNKYFPDFIVKCLHEGDVMVDTFVMRGEFTEKFLSYTNGSVYTFNLHPHIISNSYIKEKFSDNNNVKIEDIELSYEIGFYKRMRLGLMNPFTDFSESKFKTTTIDTYFENIPYSFLRLYSMSEALPILENSFETIVKYRPIIAINIGHYRNDFIEIPKLLKTRLENYLVYFRMHSYQGNDCILYAIPIERKKG